MLTRMNDSGADQSIQHSFEAEDSKLCILYILLLGLWYKSLLSEEFAKEKKIIALNKSDNSIIIAMEDPEDLSTLDAVKKLTKLNPEIFISSKSNIVITCYLVLHFSR